MKSITFLEDIELDRDEFKNLEDFQNYLLTNVRLSPYQRGIIDERIQDANENPEDYITLSDLKKTLNIEEKR
jgi:hypothetical protein